MLHVLHRWSYKIILDNFLNVHSRLRNKLLLWEHVVILWSELGTYLRLRLDNLLFILLDHLAFDIRQPILDQVSF